MTPPCLPAEDYTVGWVCALPIEHAAAELMLDDKHQNPSKHATDTNVYLLGRISGHNVVIVCLPFGRMGTNSAATVVSQMKLRFTSIEFILMVGVGGGVPSAQADIRLGDVVIGHPNSQYGGVVQYDFGKIGPGGHLTRTGFLNAPPTILLSALAKFQSNHLTGHSDLSFHLSRLIRSQGGFSSEKAGPDVLFKPDYNHVGGQTCDQCSRDRVVERSPCERQEPVVHCGTIASGNIVMKDGVTRDSWSKDLGGVLCFEMEAAGLMNSFPCLVIRGICDYADSHKNKTWQPYAAATAAACAKDLLSFIPPAEAVKTPPDEAQNSQCLRDLRLTDPRDDKDRIEASKDNLLKDSYTWILGNPAFLDWRDNNDTRLLWIKGDPGKGKTMIMIALVAELSRRLETTPGSGALSYFFCQSTIPELNNAVSVLRGLIYLLIVKQGTLIRYLRKEYDNQGEKLLEGENAFYALWRILSEMLNDSSLPKVYLMVDALDECESGLSQLLDVIACSVSESSSRVKWLVASRNRPDIEEQLRPNDFKSNISLELNAPHISQAINAFITFKVQELANLKGYSTELQDKIRGYLCEKAEGTFLWVSLVCKRLQKVLLNSKVLIVLREFSPGLDPLYERMMKQIQHGEDAEVVDFCIRILSTITFTYRPLHLGELVATAGLPVELSSDLQLLVDLCGSFLTIREETIYFIHQSAKDYFSSGKGSRILLSDQTGEHGRIASRSLMLMSNTLKRNICGLGLPGALLGEAQSSLDQSLLTPIRYACCYWVDHLQQAGHLQQDQIGLQDDGNVHIFLQKHFLHWLEALSLMGNISDGVIMVKTLESMVALKSRGNLLLLTMIYDAKRFILSYRSIIEKAPLQLYCSALVFSPKKSEIRRQFLDQVSCWITSMPIVEEDWNPSLQVLEGHSSWVTAVAFSPDSQLLASASYDRTVRLWDPRTGALRGTLQGHSNLVCAVAFSADGHLLASASADMTVRLWDPRTGASRNTLQGHLNEVSALAFSSNGQLLASASYDKTVRLWDLRKGVSYNTLQGHSSSVSALAFSPDGQLLASASYDKTVRLWDPMIGASHSTFQSHSDMVTAVAFSPDSQLLASSSYDKTVRLWDLRKGVLYSTLQGHSSSVYAVAFSPDGQLLASVSDDQTVRLWDPRTGALRGTLQGHSSSVSAVAFSPNGQLLASASYDMTVRLWDPRKGASHGTLQSHSDAVKVMAFSPDGQLLASASYKTVGLWDPKTGALRSTFQGHSGVVYAVAFSPDGQLLASASTDKTVKLWDLRTGALHSTLQGHSDAVYAVTFSPDGQLLASVSRDRTARLWDPRTGAFRGTLQGHSNLAYAVAFSPDGRLLASVSHDKTVRLWSIKTNGTIQELNGVNKIVQLSFNSDGSHLVTDRGILELKFSTRYNSQFQLNSSPYLHINQDWVTYKKEKVLWLPPDYRASCLALNNILALGHASGRVAFLEFHLDSIPLECGRTQEGMELREAAPRIVFPVNMSGFTYMRLGFRGHSCSLQRYFEKGPSREYYLLELKKMCASSRSDHGLEQTLREPVPDSISLDVDHHDVVYEMVATIPGLDERQCKASSLRLVVSLVEFPCIGLTKLDLRDRKIFAHGAPGNVVTVNASRDNEGFLLETIRESGNSPPNHHIAGIWVPHKPNPNAWFIPGGFVDCSGPDGLIV